MKDMQFNGMNMKRLGKKVIIVLVLFGIAYYISAFWFQFVLIQGDSMKPAYDNLALVIIDKRPGVLKQGDVIAFQCDSLDGILVKRIVACPGDTVQIIDGTLYVNEAVCDSLSFNDEKISFAGIAENKIVLLEDEYFVMGDNVQYSKDSRYEQVGCIREADILGKIIP